MLKFALYAILAYLLVRAVANLLRAMLQQQVGPQAGRSRFDEPGRPTGGARPDERKERATRLRDEENVEDARWEDV